MSLIDYFRDKFGREKQTVTNAVNRVSQFARQQVPQIQRVASNVARNQVNKFVQPKINAVRNTINLADNLASRAIDKTQNYRNQFKVRGYSPSDISLTGQVTKLAKPMIQGTARSVASLVPAITKKPIQVNTTARRALFGNQYQDIQKPTIEGIRQLQDTGFNESTSKKYGPAFGVAMTALDVIPGMGGKDDLVKGLVKATTKSGVKKLLPKVADDVAETIAKTTDAKAIRNLIKPQKVADALSNEARKLYHGSNTAGIEQFDSNLSKRVDGKKLDALGRGVYLTADQKAASGYGKNIYNVNLKSNNIVDLEKTGKWVDDNTLKGLAEKLNSLGIKAEYRGNGMIGTDYGLIDNLASTSVERVIKNASKAGKNGVVENALDSVGIDGLKMGDTHLVFNPTKTEIFSPQSTQGVKITGGKAPLKTQVQYARRLTPEYQEQLGNMAMELDVSTAGMRIRNESDEWSGLKSSFPQWIPQDLRQRKYIDKLLESSTDQGEFIRPKGKAGELFDVIQDELDRRIATKYHEVPVGYEKINPEEGTLAEANSAFGLKPLGYSAQQKGKLFNVDSVSSGRKIKVTGRGATGKINISRPQEFIPPKDIGIGTKIRRAFTSGDVELSNQGKSGKELADKIKFQRTNAEQIRGAYQVKLQEALKGLNQTERSVVGQVLEGKAQVSDPRIIQAAQKTRAILDDIGGKAQEIGLKIKTPSGEVPFKMKENYFPRVYDFNDLQKAGQRQKAMQHLVDTGQAQNIAEADRMLETFIKDNTIRRAGNLEHARVLDLPGYEQDPLKAINKYVDSASRRLTEANTFGATDEIAKRLIDRVRQEGGDHRYAQEVFDLMTGQKKYQNLGVDLATKFNYITKLDLGFITNATQPINTAVKTGIINTLDGVMKAYLTPNKAGKFARQIGAVTDEVVKGKAEGLTMGRIMETILSPFSYVERKNRVISAVAGKNFAEKLANTVLKNPESKYAIRQLKSVGLDPEKIIAQGKILPDDILGAAKAVSDRTQFKVDAIDIPPGWKTNIGRLLTQFKSFSFQQTKFVRDEVIKEAAAGNLQPLVKLIALAVPASFVAQSVRNKLTGRNPKEEEKSLDVRKLDTYLKAFGTIPTDLVIQGKFLADTYKNQYATPLKKIGRTISSVAGPTVGEAANVANALEQAGTIKKNNQQYNQEKDPYLEAKRIASGYLPFVGEAIKNTVFAYPATYAKGSESAGKKITEQINLLKKGKKTEESPIAQMADGKFRYRVGTESKYADTKQEAQVGLNKAKFKETGKAFEVKDGIVYRKSKDGDVSIETELSYNTKLTTQKLENAKTAKNLKQWNELAVQQEKNILKQLNDPTLDELEKTELQQKYDKLVSDAEKYASYGGFTKGRAGRSKAETQKIATAKSKYALESDRYKRAKDYKGWLKITQDHVNYLENLKATAKSQSEYNSLSNRQEDLLAQVQKYQSLGGFYKKLSLKLSTPQRAVKPTLMQFKAPTISLKTINAGGTGGIPSGSGAGPRSIRIKRQ